MRRRACASAPPRSVVTARASRPASAAATSSERTSKPIVSAQLPRSRPIAIDSSASGISSASAGQGCERASKSTSANSACGVFRQRAP